MDNQTPMRDRILTCEEQAQHCRRCGYTAGEAFWLALACELRRIEEA